MSKRQARLLAGLARERHAATTALLLAVVATLATAVPARATTGERRAAYDYDAPIRNAPEYLAAATLAPDDVRGEWRSVARGATERVPARSALLMACMVADVSRQALHDGRAGTTA